MHELALCGSIADIVVKRAPGREVRTIQLRIGQLRQVVPDTLTYCWQVVTESTQLEGSVLDIEHVPARLRCTACEAEHEMNGELLLACRTCRATTVTVIAGEEFMITSMDVMPEQAQPGQAPAAPPPS